jgi:hypothetical protein
MAQATVTIRFNVLYKYNMTDMAAWLRQNDVDCSQIRGRPALRGQVTATYFGIQQHEFCQQAGQLWAFDNDALNRRVYNQQIQTFGKMEKVHLIVVLLKHVLAVSFPINSRLSGEEWQRFDHEIGPAVSFLLTRLLGAGNETCGSQSESSKLHLEPSKWHDRYSSSMSRTDTSLHRKPWESNAKEPCQYTQDGFVRELGRLWQPPTRRHPALQIASQLPLR